MTTLPPLRARTEDIQTLMDRFFARFFQQRQEKVPVIPSPIRAAFERYAWPVNIRELENACERLAVTLNADVPAAWRWVDGAMGGDADGVFALLAQKPEPETAPQVKCETENVSLDEQLDRLENDRSTGWVRLAVDVI